jgi:hypothetical protein
VILIMTNRFGGDLTVFFQPVRSDLWTKFIKDQTVFFNLLGLIWETYLLRPNRIKEYLLGQTPPSTLAHPAYFTASP